VIRTVWLAVLCFSGVAAGVATNAGTSTPPPTVRDSPEQTTLQTTVVDTFSPDTLTKADKLEIAYVREPVAAEPIMPVAMASEEIRPPRLSPTAMQKIVSPRPHAKKPGSVSPDRRITIRESKKSKNVERGKVTVELGSCRRPGGIAGLLRAFNLSPKCDS
jgi:hypothetical protein